MARSRVGSAHISVPLWPQWQKVAGEVSLPVQWCGFVPLTSQPRPQNAVCQRIPAENTPPGTPPAWSRVISLAVSRSNGIGAPGRNDAANRTTSAAVP